VPSFFITLDLIQLENKYNHEKRLWNKIYIEWRYFFSKRNYPESLNHDNSKISPIIFIVSGLASADILS